LTGFCLIPLYYRRAPPYRGRDISLPGGRPPVNVLSKGGRSPNRLRRAISPGGPPIDIDRLVSPTGRRTTVANFERQVATRTKTVRAGQQSCPPQGLTLTEEGPAVQLYRLESDESSPQAPKARRGPPVRRSYALLTPRYAHFRQIIKHVRKCRW
jgi:hypothetical protein